MSLFDSVDIRLSENKGRGVFAKRPISNGETIDISYSWMLLPVDIELYEKTSIGGYWFDHPDQQDHGLLPIGSAALVNHSQDYNAMLSWKQSDLGYLGLLVASRDIAENEEICIDYGPAVRGMWYDTEEK